MNKLLLLDDSFSLRFVQTLLHFLWQGTAIAVVAFALDRMLQRGTARTKYALHVAAMLAMVSCLPLTFAFIDTPAGNVEQFDADQARAALEPVSVRSDVVMVPRLPFEPVEDSITDHRALQNDQSALRVELETDLAGSPLLLDTDEISSASSDSSTTAEIAAVQTGRSKLAIVSPFVTLTYLMCVAGMILRLTIGVWGGHQLRRASVSVTDAKLLDSIARQAKRIGLRLVPAIAYCEQISVPVVVGIVRPIILLPAALASGLTPDQLESLITH